MIIDVTNLIIGNIETLKIEEEVEIPNNNLENTSIRNLLDTHFNGEIKRLSDTDFELKGTLEGKMILPDDITLEDVTYPYQIKIEENINNETSEESLQIIQNKLDITDYLWQNILVEVPLKVRKKENENLTLQGDGWRLVTEEELKNSNNSPLSELSKLIDSRKE